MSNSSPRGENKEKREKTAFKEIILIPVTFPESIFKNAKPLIHKLMYSSRINTKKSVPRFITL